MLGSGLDAGMQEWKKHIKPLFPWNVYCSGEAGGDRNLGESKYIGRQFLIGER